MTPLLVLGLLAATAVAAPNSYPGPSGPAGYGGGRSYGAPHGGSGGGYGGGGYAQFSARELLNLEEYIAGVNGERVDLSARLNALKVNEGELINRLDDVLGKLDILDHDQETQDGRIRIIVGRIRENLRRIGNLEGDLAGQVEVSRRLAEVINPNFNRVNDFVTTNNVQDGLLARAKTVLDEAKEKLEEKIEASIAGAVNEVQELSDNTDAAVTVVNSKQCFVGEVAVEIGADGSGTTTLEIPDGTFSGDDIPTVFTGIQGFDSDINLGKTKKAPTYGGYGYPGGYEEEDRRQNLAIAINAQPFNDRVEVSAVDQSRGQGNRFSKVYVQVKACTFPPQLSLEH